MSTSPETPLTAGWLFVSANMKEPVSLTIPAGEVAILTQVGPVSQGENEDSAMVVAGAAHDAVLAVADGFGGGPAGEAE